MRKEDIKAGGTYSNGKGRVRRVLDIGPQYKLYPGVASEENLRYEIVLDGSTKNSSVGKQRNMSLQAFASWAKQEISASVPPKTGDIEKNPEMDISTAVSLLMKKAAKYHPCDPVVNALHMAIEALKENEWFDVRQQPPELPDRDVCGVPLLVKAEEAPDRTVFMVYQRTCPRGKRKEQWLYQGRIYDGTVLCWEHFPSRGGGVMGRYIKTVTGNEWRMLTHEQHPILSLPKRLADIREKDTVLFYQKKMKKAGGLVVGAGIVERVIPVSLNERGRIGPPRALLRFWAENIGHADDVVHGLDELGDYELPNYKVGAVLDWIWSIPLIQYVKATGTWPDLQVRARMSGFPQLVCVRKEEDLRAKIDACEKWLSRCGLIDGYGGYKTAMAVAVLEWPVVEYRQGSPLSDYQLLFAPKGMRKLG